MKKFSKLFVFAFVLVAMISLTGCKKDDTKKKYDEYVGYQFAGENPWGGELAVTIRTLENDKLTWTYTDVVGEGKTSVTVYNELATEFKDDSSKFTVKGDTEDKAYSFEYSGTLTLKDGKVVIKLESGQLTTNSTEGGSSAYQVGAIEDSNRTITLSKVVSSN